VESYVDTAAQDACAVDQLAAARKTAKYSMLESRYISANCGVDSLGPINCSVVSFLVE